MRARLREILYTGYICLLVMVLSQYLTAKHDKPLDIEWITDASVDKYRVQNTAIAFAISRFITKH
jgi:hypothetical protein